jgi:hypothetical protein
MTDDRRDTGSNQVMQLFKIVYPIKCKARNGCAIIINLKGLRDNDMHPFKYKYIHDDSKKTSAVPLKAI